MADTAEAPQHPEPASGRTVTRDICSPVAGTFNVLKTSTKSSSGREPSLIEHRTGPRSRRRRTSPEDQAVLEAAFLQTPKPDKAMRTDIVSRVTLGEKEVQIWFQNRRQIARRKVAAPTMQDESSSLASSPNVTSSTSQSAVENQTVQPSNGDEREESTSDVIIAAYTNGDSKAVSVEQGEILERNTPSFQGQEDDLVTKHINQSRAGSGVSSPTLPSSGASLQTSISGDGETSATQEMSAASLKETSSIIQPQTATGLPPLLVKRQSSSLRLSTALDGKARIVVDNGSSPPRPIHNVMPKLTRPQQPLQRSQSEMSSQRSSIMSFGDSMPAPRRLAPSRSRDAKSWDLYCDDDARNALTVQAEEEEKGRAQTTIGLIRSTSLSKQMVHPSTSASTHAKRKSSAAKTHSRPKLPRTESSLARLQTSSSNAKQISGYPDDLSKKGKPLPMLAVDLSGDLSDKENWVPGTRARLVRSPRPESQMRSRSTLGENPAIPTHSNGLESHLERDVGRQGRETETPTGKESEEPQDPEVAAFMGETPMPRVAEDLDCVQQLLSLSQGTWK